MQVLLFLFLFFLINVFIINIKRECVSISIEGNLSCTPNFFFWKGYLSISISREDLILGYRYDIISIYYSIQKSLLWVSRLANVVAHTLATWSLKCNVFGSFDLGNCLSCFEYVIRVTSFFFFFFFFFKFKFIFYYKYFNH